MIWKILGFGLVISGIVNTGAGVLRVTAQAQTVELMGLSALVFGVLLYLAGSAEQLLDERARRGGPRGRE